MVKTFSFKDWVDLTLKSGIMLFTNDHHCKERITGLKKVDQGHHREYFHFSTCIAFLRIEINGCLS